MKHWSLRMGIAALLLAVAAGCGMVKSLGKNPDGEELARLKALPNYKNGSFENLAERADSTVKHNLMFQPRPETIRPPHALPWVKTN